MASLRFGKKFHKSEVCQSVGFRHQWNTCLLSLLICHQCGKHINIYAHQALLCNLPKHSECKPSYDAYILLQPFKLLKVRHLWGTGSNQALPVDREALSVSRTNLSVVPSVVSLQLSISLCSAIQTNKARGCICVCSVLQTFKARGWICSVRCSPNL